MMVAVVEDEHLVRYVVEKGLEEDAEASWWSIHGHRCAVSPILRGGSSVALPSGAEQCLASL